MPRRNDFWHEEAIRNLNQARRWKAKVRDDMTADELLDVYRNVVGYVFKARMVNRWPLSVGRRAIAHDGA